MSAPSLQDLYRQLAKLTITVNEIARALKANTAQVEKGKVVNKVVPSVNPLGKGPAGKR